MAKFEEHCRDCERLLGDRHENVNRWIDELAKQYGANHRRHRHCWRGVREAKQLFGELGAKAAVVHIVRDCGAVPRERDYDKQNLGIVIAPEYLTYDGLDETAFEKFNKAVQNEWERWEELGGTERESE